MKRIVVACIISLAASGVAAAPPYVRVLLPLYFEQPVQGAYGSRWQSQFVVHNGSPSRSYVIETCEPYLPCLIDVAEDENLVPNKTQNALPARYPKPTNGVAGAVVWLLAVGAPPDNGDDVAFQLRVVDLSRTAIAAGTEVPVVRESEFLTSTIHLLNISTDARFRLTLRLFEMNLSQADFNMRAYDQSTNQLLFDRHLRTALAVAPLGFRPGFAEVDNLLNGLAPIPAAIRIEIEPLTLGAASWSYVSITNNDSQQITLVTPQ